jgi:protein-S-isoprenylcysteine O-methyltransferase Ste14
LPSNPVTQHQIHQSDTDSLARLGAWLFRHRTLTPLPLFAAILLIRAGEAPPSPWLMAAGVTLVVLGEALRLWGVHHIGVISRTRSDRLGPLITTGPFAVVRNPLYIGNIALWTGFAVSARLLWLAPAIGGILALKYHAIVRWEEQLLEMRLGDRYRAYRRDVPRWIPRLVRLPDSPSGSWRATLFSERGTLIAIAAGYLLLWSKARF